MDKTMQLIGRVINIILFVTFLTMIIVGQKQTGYGNLLMMLGGLVGLLSLLYLYNKKYR
ncbi:DUF6903 family protein [Kineothrix sp. MB12-C1]|uniref:DUF6903 family protein n=1 Tax=Kineothrix sp. MB12-C1 TaxID=3070215 RepID=UPI0027D2A1A4|nr:hypothetical protein [Kineothrix sp. MB12-C1]WMC94053.1 hypothetical protein RBB56_07270 [Kineothrix sp. MB12-C1]